eukprot:Skav218300  [mRNA]  locus=scaffold2388:123317:124154:+ [translate_table: standard]
MVADARRALKLLGLTACLGGVGFLRGTSSASVASTGPKYRVISVSGDGNCLFRSVAVGERAQLGQSQPLNRAEEDARSKELRAKAVAELIRERKEIEWAIEGNFDSYVRRMSRSGEWGGEPELLMLSKVLHSCIEVYMMTPTLKKIQTYGEEFTDVPAIRVLFHGYGHYSAMVEDVTS